MLYGAYYEWMIDLVRHGDKLWFSMLISRDKNSPVALHSGTMPIQLYVFINMYIEHAGDTTHKTTATITAHRHKSCQKTTKLAGLKGSEVKVKVREVKVLVCMERSCPNACLCQKLKV